MKKSITGANNIPRGLLFYLLVVVIFSIGFLGFTKVFEPVNSFVTNIHPLIFFLYVLFTFVIGISLIVISQNIYEKNVSFESAPYFGLSIWGKYDSNLPLKKGKIYEKLYALNRALLIIFVITFVPLVYFLIYREIYLVLFN